MEKVSEDIRKTMESLDKIERLEMSPLAADRIWKNALVTENKDTQINRGTQIPVGWITGLLALLLINLAFLGWFSLQSEGVSLVEQNHSSVYFSTDIGY